MQIIVFWFLFSFFSLIVSPAIALPSTCADLFNDCLSDDIGQLQQCYSTLDKVFGVQLDDVCLPTRTNKQNADMYQHWAFQNKMTKSTEPAVNCAVRAFSETFPCHPKFNPANGY